MKRLMTNLLAAVGLLGLTGCAVRIVQGIAEPVLESVQAKLSGIQIESPALQHFGVKIHGDTRSILNNSPYLGRAFTVGSESSRSGVVDLGLIGPWEAISDTDYWDPFPQRIPVIFVTRRGMKACIFTRSQYPAAETCIVSPNDLVTDMGYSLPPNLSFAHPVAATTGGTREVNFGRRTWQGSVAIMLGNVTTHHLQINLDGHRVALVPPFGVYGMVIPNPGNYYGGITKTLQAIAMDPIPGSESFVGRGQRTFYFSLPTYGADAQAYLLTHYDFQ